MSDRSRSCRTSSRRSIRWLTRSLTPSACWRWRGRRKCACWGSKARVRCWRFRICSTRNRPRRTRAICSPTWRSTRPRAFFLRTHGYLTDNPAIGPALAAHYWAPGNSVDHDRHAAQPHRRGLLGPLSGRRVQRQRRRCTRRSRDGDAGGRGTGVSGCGAAVTRRPHQDRARRGAARRYQRRRSGDVRSVRRMGARELRRAGSLSA